ncbi:hypothetical protein GFS24_05975 [Chitinophaga sp. SYP-B3965]|uniref:hypothetical protein n=1 Tax=Chitinophaga sp. SYP-B3965 TaxID=2663120 RepID=UPI0012996E0F|nr:hypothetical protein [Chitinophaga sp. SYP-B3965]MRG44651.1 hypothetical protein [Chitinophaga sp. SYP-B3965]
MKILLFVFPVMLAPNFLFAQSQQDCNKLKEENAYLRASLKINEPIKVVNSDKIEFKLLKAEGNAKSQSITFTFVLLTSAANWEIEQRIKSIIDIDGNEYELKSKTIGAKSYGDIVLNTDVPIKCTFTFGGVLPAVKLIKLFKFEYYYPGQTRFAEFRDISIDWK